MITDPPLLAPAYQTNPSADSVRYCVSSNKFTGASGFVIMIAPFPSSDSTESPLIFVATTLA